MILFGSIAFQLSALAVGTTESINAQLRIQTHLHEKLQCLAALCRALLHPQLGVEPAGRCAQKGENLFEPESQNGMKHPDPPPQKKKKKQQK